MLCVCCAVYLQALIFIHTELFIYIPERRFVTQILICHTQTGLVEWKREKTKSKVNQCVLPMVYVYDVELKSAIGTIKPNQINTIPTSRRVLVNRKRDAVYQILNTRFNQIRGVCFSDGLLKNNAKSLQWKLIYRIDRIQVVQYEIQ